MKSSFDLAIFCKFKYSSGNAYWPRKFELYTLMIWRNFCKVFEKAVGNKTFVDIESFHVQKIAFYYFYGRNF